MNFFSLAKFEFQLTQDVDDSLLVAIDRMFLLDPHPKIDHDRIYCRVLDLVYDLYEPYDPNYDAALMLRPVLVLPLNKHNKIALNSYSESLYKTSFNRFSFSFSFKATNFRRFSSQETKNPAMYCYVTSFLVKTKESGNKNKIKYEYFNGGNIFLFFLMSRNSRMTEL